MQMFVGIKQLLTHSVPQWNRRDPNNAGDMAIVK